MTQNKLKIIACISMLIDHIGYLLFPHIVILRCIGRIALPLFALVFKERERQLTVYFVGLLIFNAALFGDLWYTWFSLLAVPLLLAYNGKRGTKKLKYVFYLFYPVHFAVLYLLSLVI